MNLLILLQLRDISLDLSYDSIFDKISNIKYVDSKNIFFKRHFAFSDLKAGDPFLAKTTIANKNIFNRYLYKSHWQAKAQTITRIFKTPESENIVHRMTGGREVELYTIAFYAGILKASNQKKWGLIILPLKGSFNNFEYEETALFIMEATVKNTILPQNFNENYFTPELIKSITGKLTKNSTYRR